MAEYNKLIDEYNKIMKSNEDLRYIMNKVSLTCDEKKIDYKRSKKNVSNAIINIFERNEESLKDINFFLFYTWLRKIYFIILDNTKINEFLLFFRINILKVIFIIILNKKIEKRNDVRDELDIPYFILFLINTIDNLDINKAKKVKLVLISVMNKKEEGKRLIDLYIE